MPIYIDTEQGRKLFIICSHSISKVKTTYPAVVHYGVDAREEPIVRDGGAEEDRLIQNIRLEYRQTVGRRRCRCIRRELRRQEQHCTARHGATYADSEESELDRINARHRSETEVDYFTAATSGQGLLM